MCELKAGVIVTPHDEGMCFNRDSDVIAVTERETKFYLKSEADKVIAHNKYKRCLAMARWCERKRIEAANYRIPREKWEFYDKWHKRWLELAEKFKEDIQNGMR